MYEVSPFFAYSLYGVICVIAAIFVWKWVPEKAAYVETEYIAGGAVAAQVGPQNIFKGWDWCSGYHYSDSIIIGFSHTHLSGTGCSDLGDILLMPYTGEVRTARGEQDNIEGAASSYYKHANEAVAPGYYSLLMDNGVKAELTATERVALHRYTYPSGSEHRLLINLKEGIGDKAYDTYLKKIDEYTIEGYRFSKGWSPRHKVFFTLKCDQPIESLAVFNDDEAAGNDEGNWSVA